MDQIGLRTYVKNFIMVSEAAATKKEFLMSEHINLSLEYLFIWLFADFLENEKYLDDWDQYWIHMTSNRTHSDALFVR